MEKALRQHLPNGEFADVSPSRSRHMGAIRGKGNKSTERRLRAALSGAGLRGWRLHPARVPGKPDFYFEEAKVAVFVDGCFWHGCPECGHLPRTNSAFWSAKLTRNRERDQQKTRALQDAGHIVLRFWEHELALDLARCVTAVREALGRAEVPSSF